jgi:phosphopantothenoylcysteine decarboxylase / phosphopantothenate---cysteine ligase
MASLTIRKLDEGIKTYLRLRSAKNGRSVEEEVRVILRQRGPARRRGGGSAPPYPDHWRRHRRLQGAGPDPQAQGAAFPRPLRAD